MSEFTPQQMLDLVKQVDPTVQIMMRRFGDFYVGYSRIEEKDRIFLRGIYGNGPTPEAAIADHFNKLVDCKTLVIDSTDADGKIVRWLVQWDNTMKRFQKVRQGHLCELTGK